MLCPWSSTEKKETQHIVNRIDLQYLMVLPGLTTSFFSNQLRSCAELLPMRSCWFGVGGASTANLAVAAQVEVDKKRLIWKYEIRLRSGLTILGQNFDRHDVFLSQCNARAFLLVYLYVQ